MLFAAFVWPGLFPASSGESAVPTPALAASGPARAGAGAGAGAPPPVVVGQVGQMVDAALVEVTGSGLALRSATIRPAAAGEVVAVNFRAGQRVRAGQVLLRLDDRNQRLAVDAAANQLDAARKLQARYDATADTGAVPGSVIDEARTAAKTAQIALDQARAALADRVLLAPFDGVVGLAEVQRGDRVGTDTVVTTLDDRRSLRVAFAVPELYIARLDVGQTLDLGHHAYPGREFPGRITQIDSRVDATTRNVRLEAEVPNTGDVLRGGMSFQLRLSLPGEERLTVPELAVQYGREGAFVWAVRQGNSVQVPVQALRREDGRVLVSGELAPGEQVVVEGVQRLRDGRPVRLLNGGPDGANPAVGPAPAREGSSAPAAAAGALAVRP